MELGRQLERTMAEAKANAESCNGQRQHAHKQDETARKERQTAKRNMQSGARQPVPGKKQHTKIMDFTYDFTGPKNCPFESRHGFHPPSTKSSSAFRILTYNILADLYADSDFSRTVLFAQCPDYALKISYRKLLLLKELSGYQADIMCFQEVDEKVFEHDFLYGQRGNMLFSHHIISIACWHTQQERWHKVIYFPVDREIHQVQQSQALTLLHKRSQPH